MMRLQIATLTMNKSKSVLLSGLQNLLLAQIGRSVRSNKHQIALFDQSFQKSRSYFTNTDKIKRDDPYAQLGLEWGDGATTKELKDAFKAKARELHPDVNTSDPPHVAREKFQRLKKAYDTLMQLHSNTTSKEGEERWRFSVWRAGDRIAIDRTDVAGVLRKRPAQPASSRKNWAGLQLGHPDGSGTRRTTRAEYLSSGGGPRSPSVPSGQNKWVTPKEFQPWKPTEKPLRASQFRKISDKK